MSSRAIRKLQKLREQELQQESHDSSEEEIVSRPSKPKLNAFDLLNLANEDEDEQESENEAPEPPKRMTHLTEETVPTTVDSAKKKKKKKAKNKKKKNTTKQEPADAGSDDEELDEIDRALKELAVDGKGEGLTERLDNSIDASFPKTPEVLLAIDPKSLNATNEMRKLFGNVVLENFDQTPDSGPGRRRDRARENVDLGQALTGRYSPASRGQSLSGVTLRRNILFQGKEDWPRAPSGGLGMELVETLPNGATLYHVLHNATYKDVQRQFDICVESMDPQRMIHLLQYNPYHISTLLQVSEIAKHQSDHAVSADLLERALFNFGRSAHSSFGNRLKEGKARLDFMHMENRELWLVGWRYIANLGMKGTWRTAYEWAKLLLSLDLKDPYCIRLLIDHLALRGREYSHFIELCTQTRLSKEWKHLPNIQCSLALAYLRLNKPKECREQLRSTMSRYPWVFCKLAQELDIQPMPKRIWGKMPPTDGHELFTELYIVRAKDLWNTPEVVSLIVEVADTLAEGDEPIEPPEITLDIARHVVLSDIPRVITHLPNRFVSGRISASDPLPPYDSEAFREQSNPTPSYLSRIPEAARPAWLVDLLGHLDNGAVGLPQFQFGGRDAREDDASSEEELDEDVGRPASGAEEQVVLEHWLLEDGLHSLGAFVRQNGVDRGNWDLEVDYSPLHDYTDALNAIQPSSARQRLLDGAITDALGPMVVNLLREELEFLQPDNDEP